MNIQDQIIEFAEKHSLKDKALASIDEVMDTCIEADKEIGVDFLDGHDRAELIYEFGRYEFQVDKNGNSRIATKINIYSHKLYGSNFDMPVGYYTELTDLTGEHIDEFLLFDWSPISFNIDYFIERNEVVPQKYFRRNIPVYEFATYVNHILSLFQGRQFEISILFVKRCLDYLEKNQRVEIQKEYLIECLELFKGIHNYVKNNGLVQTESLSNYKIIERLKDQANKL